MEKVSEKKWFEMKMIEETLRKSLKSSLSLFFFFYHYAMLLQDNDWKILKVVAFHKTCTANVCIKKNPYLTRSTFETHLRARLPYIVWNLGIYPHLGRYVH